MIFLLTLIGYLPVKTGDVIGLIEQYAPEDTMSVIEETLNTGNRGLLSFGIIAALWSASNGLNAIVRAFNHAYEVEENRSFIMVRLTSLLLTAAMVFTILVALLLPVFGRAIGHFIANLDGTPEMFLTAWSALRWGISPLVLLIVFTALYFLLRINGCHLNSCFRELLQRPPAGSSSASCSHTMSANLQTTVRHTEASAASSS